MSTIENKEQQMNNATHPYTTAIVVAGGSGTRMGDTALPKQLLPLVGKPLLYHTLRSFALCPLVNAVVVVSRREDIAIVKQVAEDALSGKPVFVTEGGNTRMASVKNGLSLLPVQTAFVAIHDGARCLIHPADIEAVIRLAYQKGSATAVKPITDTVKQINGEGDVIDTLNRDTLCVAQTPQVFQKEAYEKALTEATEKGQTVTDDNRLFELMGQHIATVECRYENDKITYPKDMTYAEYILKRRNGEGDHMANMRIGQGYDVHCLKEGRPLVLGGVIIPHSKGLDGHSDADVLVHAVMDALLGAAGLPDIGQLFPDSSDEYLSISSLLLLQRVREKITEAGYFVGNIDATVVAQAPKMAPHIPLMKQKIAATLGCSEDVVNVKATTEEKLGFTGTEQGIAAHAVCLLCRM